MMQCTNMVAVHGLEFYVAQSSCIKRRYDVEASVESVSGSFFPVATTAEKTAPTFNGDGAGLRILATRSGTDTLCHTKDGAAG